MPTPRQPLDQQGISDFMREYLAHVWIDQTPARLSNRARLDAILDAAIRDFNQAPLRRSARSRGPERYSDVEPEDL